MQGKVIVRGTIRCQPDEVDALLRALADHVALSRAEPGCVQFDIVQSAHDPCCFGVTEEFIDRTAFEAHTARTRASSWWAASQHFTRDIVVTDRPSQRDTHDWTPPQAPPDDLCLSGRHVWLERLDADAHGAALFAANSAAENWAYLPYGPFDRLEDYMAWIADACRGQDPHFFAILDQNTRRALGVASYLRINPAAGSIEVGHINFSPSLQRTPGATEAMYLMMQWAFAAGYRRYEWKCNAANLASRRAAERLGLSYEGVFRNHMSVKGQNRDTAWFAAIDTEWPSLDQAFAHWLAPENFADDGQQRRRLWDLTAPFRVSDDPGRA